MKRSFVVLMSVLMVLALALAGCGSSSNGSNGNSSASGTGNGNTGGSGSSSSSSSSSGGSSSKSTSGGSGNAKSASQLEIFSWWTAGGEADGLKALLDLFKKQNPDIKVVNEAVAGGAGSNAKAILASRMQAGNPPDTFQVHAGAELLPYIQSDKMESLTDFYKNNGLDGKFPKDLVDGLSYKGNIYSIAVDIHRGNVLWYNPKIFKDNNLTPPKTIKDFFTVADKLKSKGVTPLALGDKDTWEATMLWENVLLSTLGPDKYTQLWEGKLGFDDPGVKQATETFKKMLAYTNTDASALEWQDASQLVGDGKAAMNLMGDWAKGYYQSKNLKPKEGYGWVNFPGTDGVFEYISDTFGLPKGAPHPDATKKFLKLLASQEGQDAFNPKKGSIPARVDGDMSKYDVYSKAAMVDFKKDHLVNSLAHGEAANPAFLTAANQAMQVFLGNKDVDGFIAQLKTAAQANPLG